MTYQLYSIEVLEPGLYTVTFVGDDTFTTVRCKVVEYDNIPVVQPEPDIFMTDIVSVRDLSAAIVAFDRAVRSVQLHGH